MIDNSGINTFLMLWRRDNADGCSVPADEMHQGIVGIDDDPVAEDDIGDDVEWFLYLLILSSYLLLRSEYIICSIAAALLLL